MYTRCPYCRAVFRVSDPEIEAAGGRVRCGHCREAFQALDCRLEDLEEPGEPVTAPEAAPEQGILPAAPAAFGSGMDGSPDIPNQEDDAPTAPSGESGDLLVPEALLDDAVRGARPRVPWKSRVIQGLAVMFLVLLGFAQMAWFMPQRVNAGLPRGEQALKWVDPYLQDLFGWTDPARGRRRDPSRFVLLDRDVRSDPERPGLLLVQALIGNRAGYTQPYPAIQLSLFDLNGSPVAERAFKPGEYLPPGVAPAAGMVPGANLQVRIELVSPSVPAVSYEFGFL